MNPDPNLSIHERGYLFLSTERNAAAYERNHELQRKCGFVDSVLLSPKELQERFPWMSTEGVVLGSLGLCGEGWLDPHALLMGFRYKAIAQGVRYLRGEVTNFDISNNHEGRRSIKRVVYHAPGTYSQVEE